MRTTCFQSPIHEIENHALHYLHNFVEDNELKTVTLLNIQLAKKIILEYLRLGNSFFIHLCIWNTQ